MFVSYILLFFFLLGLSGLTLTLAAFNGVFPPARPRPAGRPARPLPPMWAQGTPQHAGASNGGDTRSREQAARGTRPRGG
jgi:hypothetical protein